MKLFKTKFINQSTIVIVLKVVFILPFFFFYTTYNLVNILPDIKKIIDKPKNYQHIRIINDTKTNQSYIVLKKVYLRNHWKICFNLNNHVNYSPILHISPKQHIDLLFEVNTNEFNRLAISKITYSKNFPYHSIFVEVPDLKIILFASEFQFNAKGRIIMKDYFEDWIRFTQNIVLFFLLIFAIFHLQIGNKMKYLYYSILIILTLGIGFILYNDIFYLLKIYKII